MNGRAIRWSVLAAGVLLAVAYLVYQRQGAIALDADMTVHASSLVAHRCEKSEAVDRRLLQQSWFHDAEFTRLAGAFGRTSFSLYDTQTPSDAIEGAFCVDGTDLMVRYFERQPVPMKVSVDPLSVSYGFKLRPLGEDIYSVRELTESRMILTFASDGREHVFYRKN